MTKKGENTLNTLTEIPSSEVLFSIKTGIQQWTCFAQEVDQYRRILAKWGYATKVIYQWEDSRGKWAKIAAVWPIM